MTRDDVDLFLLQAIAHGVRLAVVRHLAAHGPATATELTVLGDVGQSTMSHHLKVLRQAGWVEAERRGSWIWYALRDDPADRLGRIADSLRAHRAPLATTSRSEPAAEGPRPGSARAMEESWRQW